MDSRVVGTLLIVGILASMATISLYMTYTPAYVVPTSASVSGTMEFEVVEAVEEGAVEEGAEELTGEETGGGKAEG